MSMTPCQPVRSLPLNRATNPGGGPWSFSSAEPTKAAGMRTRPKERNRRPMTGLLVPGDGEHRSAAQTGKQGEKPVSDGGQASAGHEWNPNEPQTHRGDREVAASQDCTGSLSLRSASMIDTCSASLVLALLEA